MPKNNDIENDIQQRQYIEGYEHILVKTGAAAAICSAAGFIHKAITDNGVPATLSIHEAVRQDLGHEIDQEYQQKASHAIRSAISTIMAEYKNRTGSDAVFLLMITHAITYTAAHLTGFIDTKDTPHD